MDLHSIGFAEVPPDGRSTVLRESGSWRTYSLSDHPGEVRVSDLDFAELALGVVSSHRPLVGAGLAIDVPVVAQASHPIGPRAWRLVRRTPGKSKTQRPTSFVPNPPPYGACGQVVGSSARIGHRRVQVRWVTPLGDETASKL